MPCLIVIQGPDQGQTFDVDRTVTIGRLSSNDVQLRDEQVSRQHARLEVGSGGVVAVDLGSRKGIQVNGKAVDRHRLSHGDSLLIGTTVLRFETGDAPPPPLPGNSGAGAEPAPPPRVSPRPETPGPVRRASAGPLGAADGRPPSRRLTPRPAIAEVAASEAAGADVNPRRRGAVSAPQRTSLVQVLLGAVILAVVFWVSQWVGFQAVQQVLKDRPSAEKK